MILSLRIHKTFFVHTKNFTQLNKNSADIAGGKGASLGEMTKAGIPVPPGFVVLSTTFDKFIDMAGLNKKIEGILKKVKAEKTETVEKASKEIRALIMAAAVSSEIIKEIKNEYKKLGAKFVAVRSSATAEDGAEAAWAGQLESYLNTTEKSLIGNVRKCWASLFTPRAIFYRIEKKMSGQKISVAVVVQKMVESEVSGIAFSVHPVTEDYNQLIIEAGFGLGEAIVSGSITPDSYVVDKAKKEFIENNIAKQERQIVRSVNGGVEWVDVVNAKQEKQKLSDKQIIELSRLIIKIEKHYNFPCDIEWAFEKGIFYIVQSRPITTLANSADDKTEVFDYIKNQKWFFGVRADESLLFYSAKRNGYEKYFKKEYGVEFAETLLIPIKKDHPIRVFNLAQAKKFHKLSAKKIEYNPQIISDYIDQNNQTYRDIEMQGKKMLKLIEQDKYAESLQMFKKLFDLYEIAGAQYIIVFSLGLKLTGNSDRLKGVKAIVSKHDTWRNSVAFKEEKMGEAVFYYLKYLVDKKNLKIDPLQLMKYLTLNEIEQWLDEKLVDLEIKKIINSRKKQGFIYLNLRNETDEIIDNQDAIDAIRNHFLALDKQEKTVKNKNEISGQVAYNSGEVIRGEVVVIKDKADLKSKKSLIDGKILVAIQTTPHYIPYVKNALAIITDEGGITCHAAIISREMKKPCITGTKNATEILRDGDLVEVDADRGVIRMLRNKVVASNNFEYLKQDDYIRLFEMSNMPLLLESLALVQYIPHDTVVVFRNNIWTMYLSKKAEKQTLKEGVRIFGNTDNFIQYEKDFLRYLKDSAVSFNEALKKKQFTRDELWLLFENISELWRYYQKTEFFYVDEAYKKSRDNKVIAANLKKLENFKQGGRAYMNKMIFGNNSFLFKVLMIVAKQLGVDFDQLWWMSTEEILGLFTEKNSFDKSLVSARKKSYSIIHENKKSFLLVGSKSLEFINSFFVSNSSHSEIIKGVTANSGRVKGVARVFEYGASTHDSAIRLVRQMKNGEILVAESTTPEIAMACKKAVAILANQGGLLSHAAIISRELNIPCIVGLGNVTKRVKTGDLVEVDANKGTVKIIKNK